MSLFASPQDCICLDATAYQRLRADATVLEADSYGDKVLRLADGSFFKFFRRKRLLSSALFYPYARRFADNANLLQARDLACPQIIQCYRLPHIDRDAVHYHPLPGHTLRQIMREEEAAPQHPALARQFGCFVARLHREGIYFRSLHLGNVVFTPQAQFGLIDIADLRFCRAPLRAALCRRNFKHLLRNASDRDWLMQDGGKAFEAGYRGGN
jgi:tRNA A-37 threonylcarbamoyl transferase component Bud32